MSVMAVKLILLCAFIACTADFSANGLDAIHGRYTRDIRAYELAIPHQLAADGSFLTYRLPSHYQHEAGNDALRNQRHQGGGRRRRHIHTDTLARSQRREPAHVHYGLPINGKLNHLELWPNHALIAPNAVVEHRKARARVQDRTIRKLAGGKFCHYTGQVRGDPKSKVALTTCGGLAGYVATQGKRYFVEPVLDHEENHRGQLMHIIYESEPHRKSQRSHRGSHADASSNVSTYLDGHSPRRDAHGVPFCGTSKNWEDAWRNRFRSEELAAVSRHGRTHAGPAEILSGEDGQRRQYIDGDNKSESRRGVQSVHRYLETLVVADKKFLEHHKNTDYDTYVMTIMNMVADYYHDASSGNQMDVVVVRLMYLEKEEEEIDLEISADADKTLASFCKWQQRINPTDIHNPNHHDIAVLLTRYDICTENMTSCSLMGLAYVATACTEDQPCAINEDSGLILAIVVAHEMGHVMGCAHDSEEESGCQPQAADESYHVMSPFVHQHTTKWSTCSRAFITTLFNNDLGECLNDEPEISLYDGSNTMLAGTVYDATYQCQMAYPGSKVCQTDPEKFCQMLLCRTDPETCMGNGEPPADGTKCGENKWCYSLKCVEIGERPDAINGGWGDWGPWSECSRPCGGGVSHSERDCNNPQPQHNGRYCIGERRKVKLCNTNSCPTDEKSFRTKQCEAHNTIPFNGANFTWKAYLKEGDPCVLYCLNDENVFAKLEPRCKDGTRCKMGTKNMCLSGVCRTVGCDFVLDSDAAEDECGECRGDGTSCKLVSKTFDGPPGHGYVKVGVIFKGCRNILIEELGPSDNTLAIKNADETIDFLNGNYSEAMDGVREIGGAHSVYTHPEPNKEMLMIHGPLKEDIVLFVVFYENKNIGYTYKYAEPSTKASSYKPSYHWEFIEWGECSARCGGGSEIAEAQCIEEKAGKVANSFCPQTERPPPKSRVCNEMPCPTRWRVGKWSSCRPCQSQSGVRSREVECIREAKRPGTEDVLVEDNLCSEKKPGSKEVCVSQQKCKAHEGKPHRGTDDNGDGLSAEHEVLGSVMPAEVRRQMWLQSLAPVWDHPGLTMDMLPHEDMLEEANCHRIVRKKPPGVQIVCVPLSKVHKKKKPAKDKENKEKADEAVGDKNKNHGDGEEKTNEEVGDKNKEENGDKEKAQDDKGKIEDHGKSKEKTDEEVGDKNKEENSDKEKGHGGKDKIKDHGKGEEHEDKKKPGSAHKDKEDKNEGKDGKGGESGGGKSVAEGGTVVLKTGSVAHDPIPADAIKEISVHVKQSHSSLNLTDEAFEAMGDKVPDTLDFANMTVLTGQKGAELKKEQAHTNHSMEHSNLDIQ